MRNKFNCPLILLTLIFCSPNLNGQKKDKTTVTVLTYQCQCTNLDRGRPPHEERIRITSTKTKKKTHETNYDFLGYSGKFFRSFKLKRERNQVYYWDLENEVFREFFAMDQQNTSNTDLPWIPNFGAKLISKKFDPSVEQWQLSFDLVLKFSHIDYIYEWSFDRQLGVPKYSYYNGVQSYDCHVKSP